MGFCYLIIYSEEKSDRQEGRKLQECSPQLWLNEMSRFGVWMCQWWNSLITSNVILLVKPFNTIHFLPHVSFLPDCWMLWFCRGQIHQRAPSRNGLDPWGDINKSPSSHKNFWKNNIAKEDTVEGLKKDIKLTISTIVSGQWQKWFHGCKNGGKQTIKCIDVIIRLQKLFKSFLSNMSRIGIYDNNCNRLVTLNSS